MQLKLICKIVGACALPWRNIGVIDVAPTARIDVIATTIIIPFMMWFIIIDFIY